MEAAPATQKGTTVHQDLVKPMRLLLYEGKYALASITVVMTSLAFVMALGIRDMTSTCINWAFELNDVKAANCLGSVVDGVLSFFAVLMVAIVVMHTYAVAATAPERITTLRLG